MVEREVSAGWESYRRGDWAGAERSCQNALMAYPSHARALGLLGALRLTAGRAHEAEALLTRALQSTPRDAMLLSGQGLARLMQGNAAGAEQALRGALKWGGGGDAMLRMRLGMALGAQGKVAEAVAELRRALQLAPDSPDVMLNLANALAESGVDAEAESLLKRLLARVPAHGDARFNLGTLYTRLNRLEEAQAEFRTLLTHYPGNTDAHNSLGVVLERQNRLEDAGEQYRKALELDARHVLALNNLGNVLRVRGEFAQAQACYDKAQALAPAHVDAYLNLGMLRVDEGRPEEARALFDKALSIDPKCIEAALNLSLVYKDLARPDASIAAARQAVAIAPQSTEAHRKLAHALLWAGDLSAGWPEYEWRLRESRPGLNRYALPPWRGERGSDVRLLLWNEQGVGDEVLYLGLIAELAISGISVTIEVDKRLASMVARSISGVLVVPKADPPAIDVSQYTHQSTLASIAQYLRPNIDTFPQGRPYLVPDPVRVQSIRSQVLHAKRTFVVGLSWSSANREVGREKSIDLVKFAPLFDVPEVVFMNLQYGDVSEQLQSCVRDTGREIINCSSIDFYSDLEGLAAACAACDLVITVSSVAAHVAGAVGSAVWLIVPRSRGRFWYWFHGKTHSPWYASVRVFEQHTIGQWDGVLADVRRELQYLVDAK